MRRPGRAGPKGPGAVLDREGDKMIVLRKMNGEQFLVNHNQIECIELIPESKVVMMNHDYYLVQESADEIIAKIADYNAKVQDIYRQLTVQDNRK